MDAKSEIREFILSLKAEAVGFARVGEVPEHVHSDYLEWLGEGCHGGMAYLDRYHDIRQDPRLLLPGAETIICCAFPYPAAPERQNDALKIASYALGEDYHDVVRRKLKEAVRFIRDRFGAKSRAMVDTAPMRERYWAVESGIGFRGLNGLLILPGKGSRFFLGEILTTLKIEPDEPCTDSCISCGKCLKACPGKALSIKDGKPMLDARKCLSYLTIEHHGDCPEGTDLGDSFYGCDTCQDVCPHNIAAAGNIIEEFSPRKELLSLRAEDIENMDDERYSALFGHSAMRRAPLEKLRSNLKFLRNPGGEEK